MKFIPGLALAMGLVLTAGAPLAAQSPKIVFIDSQRLRNEAPGLQAAKTKIEQEMTKFQAQADSTLGPLQQEFQNEVEQFQQQQSMMTADKRDSQQKALAQKQQQLQQRSQELQQQAQTKQNEILQPALEKVNQVIDQLRKEKGYAFILDVASGGVIAADPSLDITDEVLTRLKASGGK